MNAHLIHHDISLTSLPTYEPEYRGVKTKEFRFTQYLQVFCSNVRISAYPAYFIEKDKHVISQDRCVLCVFHQYFIIS